MLEGRVWIRPMDISPNANCYEVVIHPDVDFPVEL